MAIEEIDPHEAMARQDRGWHYVDVRTPEEFALGHPMGAINIPVAFPAPGGMVPNPRFVAAINKHFALDTPLLMGCRSGGRSLHAARLLQQVGYAQVVNVGGGFLGAPGQPGWKPLGLPSTTDAAGIWTGDDG